MHVLQGLATQQVRDIADSLLDSAGNETAESEAVRAALQGLTGCAGGIASGQGSCGAGAMGAAASVVLNNLLRLAGAPEDNSGTDINGDGVVNEADERLSLAQQQARSNLVATLVGLIAQGAGISVPGAITAAQLETQNNELDGNPEGEDCQETGTTQCVSYDEAIAQNQDYIDAGIVDREHFDDCYAVSTNSCDEGRDIVINELSELGFDSETLDGLSDERLIDLYTGLTDPWFASLDSQMAFHYNPSLDPNSPLYLRPGIEPLSSVHGLYVDRSLLSENYGTVYDSNGNVWGELLSPGDARSVYNYGGLADTAGYAGSVTGGLGAIDGWSPETVRVIRGTNGALTVVGGGLTALDLSDQGYSTGASITGGAASAGGGLLAGGGGAVVAGGVCTVATGGACGVPIAIGGIGAGAVYVFSGADDFVATSAAEAYDNPPRPQPIRRDFTIPSCGIGVTGLCLPPILNGEFPSGDGEP